MLNRPVPILKGSVPRARVEAHKAKGVRAERPKSGDKKANERQQDAKFEPQCRERLFNVIRAKTPTAITGAELRLVAETLWKLAGRESRLRLVSLWDWADKTKASDVVYSSPVPIENCRKCNCVWIHEVRTGQWDTSKPEALLQTAKRLRIEPGGIRKTLKAEVAAEYRRACWKRSHGTRRPCPRRWPLLKG